MKGIKVCFVSHLSSKGGAEGALLELLDALTERGIECNVILPSEGPLGIELTKRKITYCTLPYKWWAETAPTLWRRIKISLWNLFMAIPMAIRINRWKCDLVMTNSIVICDGALAARLLCLPHVWYIHEFGYKDHGLVFHLGQKISLGLINRLSKVCLVNSETMGQEFRKYIAPSKLKVVYQSVTVSPGSVVEHLPSEPNSILKCIVVGSLHKGKRQEDAIRAISEIVRRGIRAELFIIGSGSIIYHEFLRNLVIKYNLEKQVSFIGYVENAFPFIQDADVLLMCSRSEAFGRVTIEAMKAGKPVIAARSGANLELIREGFNGLLYTTMNYEELADKIQYLYEHPNEARQMGNNGLQWALERFNANSYGERVMGILNSLISR